MLPSPKENVSGFREIVGCPDKLEPERETERGEPDVGRAEIEPRPSVKVNGTRPTDGRAGDRPETKSEAERRGRQTAELRMNQPEREAEQGEADRRPS